MSKPIDNLRELLAAAERGEFKIVSFTEKWDYERDDETGEVWRTGVDTFEILVERPMTVEEKKS